MYMKKAFLIASIALFFMSMSMNAQTYSSLWKEVTIAENDDLPQTQREKLKKIIAKAEKEKAYGQLLKALLTDAQAAAAVSPDSLAPAVERLKEREQQAKDIALQAVYQAVLSRIYDTNPSIDENSADIAKSYAQKAVSHPKELAAVKATDYVPFVQKGADSQIYNDDLLSLIGIETKQYQAMYDYYMTTTNRRAQLMSKLRLLASDEPSGRIPLKDCDYVRRLDSLANAYADLQECGEVAITRYEFMDEETDATAGQKIAYIDEALNHCGSWKRMTVLRNARQSLTARQFNATLEHRVWIPNRQQELRFEGLRGVDRLTINIYKVDANGDIELNPEDETDYKKLKPLLKLLPEQKLMRTYNGKKEYEIHADTIQMAGLPVGVYMMEVESEPRTQVARMLFFISDVRVMMQPLPYEHDNQLRYVVVNATTGKPIRDAQLRLASRRGFGKNKIYATLTTDEQGEAIYRCKNQERPNYVFATTDDDRFCPEVNVYGNFNYYANERVHEQTAIYTDRAIYRPGQTVHVAAICYETRNGFEHEVLGNKQVTVSLRDANYKTIGEQQLTTDEYGTVSADFTLPTSGLTGRYSVLVEKSSQWFNVEEYKRPAFQVEFPKVEQNYKAGDTLTVRATARTYSGVPVQNAHVKYKVERRLAFWWFSYSRYWGGVAYSNGQQSEEVFSGEVTTGDDGMFEVRMPMIIPPSHYPQFYNFVVVADVTDLAGETHQGQLSLPLGNRDGVITIDLAEKVLLEDMPKMKLHLLNTAGNDVSVTIRYQIDGGKWLTAPSNTPIELPKLKSGKHKLNVEYEDKKEEQEFIVFSLNDRRPATETDDWFYVSDRQFPNDGTPVTLQAGASGDVHVIYTLVAGTDIIEMGAVDLRNDLINRKLTYKEEYGNGLTLSYIWVRDGKTYKHSHQIQRPLPDKKLRMKWETFRDRLTPGQQEEWTLKIETPDTQRPAQSKDAGKGGSKPNIQLLATLYDKSLDQITAHHWTLKPINELPMAQLNWRYGMWFATGCSGFQPIQYPEVNDLQFSHFDHDIFPTPWSSRRRLYSTTRSLKGLKAKSNMVLKEVAVGAQKAMPEVADVESYDEASLQGRIAGLDIVGNDDNNANMKRLTGSGLPTDEEAELEIQVRENLQETAFFYPRLMADSTGTVSIQFTLPESLTTWRFMGIAHTKDMMYGSIDGEAVAQKDVMIQPNMPRFLRMGDEGSISARIFNMTDKGLNSVVRLTLSDPESNQVVFKEEALCLLEANKTAPVTFHVDASKLSAYSLLVCKMSVSGDNFSDGEQHYLPILPNRERVTVTVPFTQTKPGTKTIDLTSIVPATVPDGDPSGKYTIEYTNNPAWLMIQALPTVAHPHDNCAICQASAFYANSIGKHILDQNPQAKHVFELWKQENGAETSLHSSLEKNEELKDLLLNETPWVMDADREAEQKQRLSDFFDANLMTDRLNTCVEQLKKLQNTDGSWSWWPGMDGSFYMTVEISELLVRLNQMTERQKESEDMLRQAISFMDKEILELVAEMKKLEKKGIKQTFPSYKALQYLYISTLDGRKLTTKVSEAQTYLKNLLKKDIKRQTIYEKALSAIILNAPLYIKSLKEYTVYKEDMGRYYDSPRASYSWRDYRIPTQVAAIEAIQRLMPKDTTTIDEMRRWLLQEKRAQAWDTPINSADAIYAFLNGKNSQTLQPQAKTTLKIDGKPLPTSEATAGVGYVKTALPIEGQNTFTAEKTSTGTSWGAVYAQFMQDTKDIKDQSSEISVKREIIGGDSSSLKVGSRIKVRITITAQRDLDFVEVIDRRAACMEPINQLSGYHYGYYCAPKDNATHFFFNMLSKGKHVIETEYYIDRAGTYETGTCTAQCAYAPEFRGTTHSVKLRIDN